MLFGKEPVDAALLFKSVSAYENNRFAEGGLWYELGAYSTFDMTLGYTLGSRHTIRIYLEMINIFDKAYSTVVGYPDYGRQILLGCRYGIQ
jgi:outer membrane cobalamin receptor